MNIRIKTLILCAVMAVGLISTPAMMSQALDLGNVLGAGVKILGIGFIVDKYGKEINDFINKLMDNNNVDTNDYTKVVPILSMGDGGYVGAVQVLGTKAQVEKCQAVVQIEGNALFGNALRIRALIPVESRSITNIKRLKGVGVSALIDIKL